MKKRLLMLVLVFSSFLCFSQTLVGARLFLVPNFVTGGNIVAENDLYSLIYTYGILKQEAEDVVNTSRSNFAVGAEAYLQVGITQKIAIEGTVGITSNQGYTTDISVDTEEGKETISSYERKFKTIDFSVLGKYTFAKSSMGYLSAFLGPKLSYTGKSISEGIFINAENTSVQEYEPFQNKFLFGVKAGAEAAITVANKTLVTVNASGFYDFTPVFKEEIIGEWFSNAVGNRLGFYIGIGIAYSLK